MDGENRAVPGDVEDAETRFLHNVCHSNFYRVTELLYRQQQDELSLRTAPERETVRFRASASTVFPLRDIESLEKNAAGQYIMTTTFLGLSGSSSPLPGYYLDNLACNRRRATAPRWISSACSLTAGRSFCTISGVNTAGIPASVRMAQTLLRSVCTRLSGWATRECVSG